MRVEVNGLEITAVDTVVEGEGGTLRRDWHLIEQVLLHADVRADHALERERMHADGQRGSVQHQGAVGECDVLGIRSVVVEPVFVDGRG